MVNERAKKSISKHYSSLTSHIRCGYTKLVQLLGEKNGEIDKQEEIWTEVKEETSINLRESSSFYQNDWTPLHDASYLGNDEVVETLIKNGAKIGAIVKNGVLRVTPLHLAVMNNHLSCAKILLQHGASANSHQEDICRPMHIAVFITHNAEMAALLLDYGADVNLRYNDKFFELFGDKKLASLWRNQELPLLHCSILEKDTKMTKLLMDRGADVDLETRLGKTTLMQAVEVNDEKLVRLLIFEKNANVNHRDFLGKTPLHCSILNFNTQVSLYCKKEKRFAEEKLNIVRYLVEAGADANVKYPSACEEATVLHRMIIAGYFDIVTFLLYNSNFNYNLITLKTICNVKVQHKHTTAVMAQDYEYLRHMGENMDKIFLVIVNYLILLSFMGFPVRKELMSSFPNHSRVIKAWQVNQIKEIREDSLETINNLKDTYVGDSGISYWRLLTCGIDELSKLMSREDIRNLDVVYEDGFHLYYYMLKRRLQIANQRRDLVKVLTEVVCCLGKNLLPYDCCLKIVHFFDHQELKAFFMLLIVYL